MKKLTEEEITKDRQERVAKCKGELEKILEKYQLALTAEDMLGHTKIHVEIQFMDMKKFENAEMAQPEAPIIPKDISKEEMEDLLDPNKNEKL